MSHLIAKELPVCERPYEKCLNYGVQYLSDAELLAVILKTGTRTQNVVQLAQSLLSGHNENLLNLYDLSMEEMIRFSGIGKVKAIQLKCIAEISKRIAAARRKEQVRLGNSKAVAQYYMERMRHEKKEHMIVSLFDTKGQLIDDEDIAIGTIRSVLSSPREIFLSALQKQAVQIILLHNHPSGEPQPSTDDIRLTRRVKECGDLLEIQLIDHIIIGDNNYYSFAENGDL